MTVTEAAVRPIAPILPAGLDTPALVIDLDIVERNARRMAEAVAGRGINLRPHTKTHKSVALARTQIEAGAHGITVGTLGEAEVMAAGGIDDILLAYPLWADAEKAPRLRALHEREGLRLTVGVDSVAGGQKLAEAVSGSGLARAVAQPGAARGDRDRSVVPPDRRRSTDRRGAGVGAARSRPGGRGRVHAWRPRLPRTRDGRRRGRGRDRGNQRERGIAASGRLRARNAQRGLHPTALRAAAGIVNEVRPGTYLINDRIQVYMGSTPPDGVAMAVAATVVSEAAAGKFVINAGAKSLTKDLPPYLEGYGFLPDYPEGVVERLSDYHGEVRLPDGADLPSLGDVVAVIPNHACPVIDLFDTFVATRSGEIVGSWPVDARGRSG